MRIHSKAYLENQIELYTKAIQDPKNKSNLQVLQWLKEFYEERMESEYGMENNKRDYKQL